MKNIDESVVKIIKENSLSLYETFNTADKWVNKNLKYENKEKVSLEVKHARRIIRKINNSIDYKPVFALFGVSQVGKSYLVKNLLSLNGQALEIELGNAKYDFLKEINPEGSGAESTGVVTRFSTECKLLDPNYPVKIRLLSIKDIVIILCDSFFTDVRAIANYPSENDFIALGDKLLSEHVAPTNTVSYLHEDDILEIQDYFERNFYHYSHITERINKSNFWLKLAAVSGKLKAEEFINAFSILWNNYSLFNDLFINLIKKLDEIKFPKHVFAKAEAVLRTHGDILNVQRVKELNKSNNFTSILDSDSNKYEINVSYLSALSEEITLTISKELENEKPFLINTDLLDFPGAKSRLENAIENVDESATPQMFLRGKVAYLFNRYSADYEINNLLFCQHDVSSNVKEIPSMLYEWIANNVGKTAAEREKNLKKFPVSPLFIVFTFINNQLRYDSTNDNKDLKYKWNNRFNRFFEEDLITSNYNWHIDWSENDPLFKNFYLLRDYKYSSDTFEGFETEKKELNINPNRTEYINRLKDSFTTHPFVVKHMPEAEEMWNQISHPNSDGSNRILQNLMPAANNAIKIQNYSQIIFDKLQLVKSKLEPHFQSDNVHEMRQIALSKGNDLHLELNRIIGRNPMCFGEILKTFMLDEADVYIYIHENLVSAQRADNFDEYVLFRAQFPELNPSYTTEQNLDILRNTLGYASTDLVLQFLSDKKIDLNKLFKKEQNSTASVLIDGLFNKWASELNFENNNNISKGIYEDILDILNSTIKQLELKNHLQKQFENKTTGIHIERPIEENLASIFCYTFNEFVSNIGFNFIDHKDLNEIGENLPSLRSNIQNLMTHKSNHSSISLNDLFNHSANVSAEMEYNPMLENYTNFIFKLKVALMLNCGFVNYDVEANAELGSILDQLNTIKSRLN
jgi:hypothetical protein